MGNKNTEQKMDAKPPSASRWLSGWMKEARKAYMLAGLLTLLSAGCFVVFSWYLSRFAADWLVSNQLEPGNLWVAVFFLTGRYLLAHFAALINYRAGESIVSKIKKQLYPKILHNSRTDAISATLLVTRVSDDLKPYFAFFLPYATASVLVSLLLLTISFWFEVWVGLTLLISFLVIPFQMIMIGVGAESLHKKHIDLFMKYSAVFYNRLHTVAEIVNLNNLLPQQRFLAKKSADLNQATIQVMRVAVLSSAVLELFVSIAIAGVAIYLGMSLMGIMPGENYGKGYDFHVALFLLMLAPYFFFYLRKFVSAYHDRNKALASAKLLMPYWEESEEAPLEVDNEALQSIEIKGLSFAYPDSLLKVLHNINLQLPAKGLVLIKGISGSGKSTLLKLLSGSLKAEEGQLSVNEKDHRWSTRWLRENTSYMNQFPFLFDGSLHYNVFLDRTTETPSGYPDFLNKLLAKKEAGWQTELSHNGKQLSGGEKQLLTLARMMLHPRPVALLDEPTANLDPGTTEVILEQIRLLSQRQLCIVASHEEKFDAHAAVVLNLNWGEQM